MHLIVGKLKTKKGCGEREIISALPEGKKSAKRIIYNRIMTENSDKNYKRKDGT